LLLEVVVADVPEVVVEVVPVVDVADVIVVAVLEVSVIVPPGIAEVEVEPVVSVAIVPVVIDVSVVEVVADVSTAAAAVSVLLLFTSLLHAKPKTLRARTVRRTTIFLLMFCFSSRCLLLCVVLNGVGSDEKCRLTPLGNRIEI
jgi:hypothetical protein